MCQTDTVSTGSLHRQPLLGGMVQRGGIAGCLQGELTLPGGFRFGANQAACLPRDGVTVVEKVYLGPEQCHQVVSGKWVVGTAQHQSIYVTMFSAKLAYSACVACAECYYF